MLNLPTLVGLGSSYIPATHLNNKTPLYLCNWPSHVKQQRLFIFEMKINTNLFSCDFPIHAGEKTILCLFGLLLWTAQANGQLMGAFFCLVKTDSNDTRGNDWILHVSAVFGARTELTLLD